MIFVFKIFIADIRILLIYIFFWLIVLCAHILLLQCICRFGCLTWLNFKCKVTRFFEWDAWIVITIMCTISCPAQPLKTMARVKLCKVCQVCFYLLLWFWWLSLVWATEQTKSSHSSSHTSCMQPRETKSKISFNWCHMWNKMGLWSPSRMSQFPLGHEDWDMFTLKCRESGMSWDWYVEGHACLFLDT